MAKGKKNDETFNTEFRDRYTIDKSVRTPSGAYSVSNRDDVAKALNGLTVEQLEKIAARADVAERWAKWSKLNPGMQRMNLGNVLRGAKDDAKAKAALTEARKMPRTAKPVNKVKTKNRTKKRAVRVAPKAPAEVVATA